MHAHSPSFKITKSLFLEEIQSTLTELLHVPTGAKVMHIANEDPENLFCLSLQTIPKSSNGVAHILEHITLCGSKKFPIKDPFFSMARRSLNTYMNALTGQDFTCYPASSQIEKDFYNLLEVYLDAVFFPELRYLSFLQEGHRLELSNPIDLGSPLQYQGVVYNEMKGALSSPDARVWEALLKHLTPDLPYALNSGGDPKEIPNLTYEELKEFHQTHYHPSRCLFFFYGNLPLEKHLDFLSKQVLNGAEKKPPLPLIPPQRKFTSPVSIEERYPLAPHEPKEKSTWFVFSWLTTPILNQEESLALSLLESILMDTDASPLKRALLKSGLCSTADSSIDVEMSEIPISILCKGCQAGDLEKLEQLLFTTLKTISFTKEQIEGALHQLEFQRSEMGADSIPFGLVLFFRAALTAQHGVEPESALLIHSLFEALRENLKNPNYLTDLIQKYFLDNPHYVRLTFLGDPQLLTEEKRQEEEQLAKLKPQINLEELLKQTKDLSEYQEQVETQSLNCLPKLELKDIPIQSPNFPLEVIQQEGLTVFHHNCFTNQILYADLVLNLPPLPAEDLSLLSLYTQFMTEVGCGKRNYEENLTYQQTYTGGIDASLAIHINQDCPDAYQPTFMLRGKALARNQGKLLTLMHEFIQGVRFDEEERLRELLSQQLTYLQNRLARKALSYATQTALSNFSTPSYISNQWGGLPFYRFVLEWAQKPEALRSELERIQKTILGKSALHLVLSCDQEQFSELSANRFYGLATHVQTKPVPTWEATFRAETLSSHVCFISSPVAFTAQGFQTVTSKHPQSPYLLLATELLENCYLHREVREKGGAYGGGASYSPSSGNFYFYAYRDPQLAKTMESFEKAVQKIASKQFSEEELEEAKFGIIQSLDSPVSPGSRAMTSYLWNRSNRTYEDREKYRAKVLNATREEIANAISQIVVPANKTTVSFLGEELYKKESTKVKVSLEVQSISTALSS